MYLKSIEIQGFKSFANKIVFQFHNGITGIVGPNGSGKSNVADAVRWVLGEQSARQLRGGSMQDVIFAGTENRKPLSYASVAITLDNKDHILPVSYEEVTVTRRLYRSGESEYLLNGTICRLKDVNELFYDTGIGKEGYSIIGQGQIDKILSGRPEERRELFDEAAGIVKFKRRKMTAQKKLEEEEKNLVRVRDILNELKKQLGPLQRQAEKAKVYLERRERLKIFDVNLFLLEMKRVRRLLKELEEKQEHVKEEMDEAKEEQERTKAEYESLEKTLGELNAQIESAKEQGSRSALERQKMENHIALLCEQIHSIEKNFEYYEQRARAIEENLVSHQTKKEQYLQQLQMTKEEKEKCEAEERENERRKQQTLKEAEEAGQKVQEGKDRLIAILNQRSSFKVKMQRYDTMLEQIGIRKAELSQRILRLRSEEAEQEEKIHDLEEEASRRAQEVKRLEKETADLEEEAQQAKQTLTAQMQEMEKEQALYHREASRLESLIGITQRYEGYGNSIRRVMEQKEQEPGILGVVADLIRVDRKYETAIETALGASLQNVVTKDEETAKRMIGYLKKNRAGRATFLPLTAIRERGGFSPSQALKEPGVIGLASELVKTQDAYRGIVSYLLGKTVVADHIDHAIALARKYSYSLRIVTTEGESFSPGGSMTGGTFKNTGNLLGRRRETEELSEHVQKRKKELERMNGEIEQTRQKRAKLQEEITRRKEDLQKEYLEQNTTVIKWKQMRNRQAETRAGYAGLKMEASEMEGQVLEISEGKNQIAREMEQSHREEKETENQVETYQKIEQKKREEQESYTAVSAQIGIRKTELLQKKAYLEQDLERIADETEALEREKKTLKEKQLREGEERAQKEEEILRTKQEAAHSEKDRQDALAAAEKLQKEKEKQESAYKSFFQRQEEISDKIRNLDKESVRLTVQKERAQEWKERQTAYLWEEYELTPSRAAQCQKEELHDSAQIRQEISQLKSEIRSLGSVNINALEEYKEVSERHNFLYTQHEDLTRAKEALENMIAQLDEGMRRQFKEKFGQIQSEFNRTFQQLFGGGKGTLELMEGEDLLEAGIRIIAQPPGKKLQNMMQLSGGEKALTAIALLFAIQNLKPSPFCLLDEIEAALDDSNVGRYARYLHKLTKNTQFIIITHRRGTMEAADRLYGITMQEKGVSALVSVNLIEDKLEE